MHVPTTTTQSGLLIFTEYQWDWDKITVWSVEEAKKQKVKFLQVRKEN